MKNEQKKKTQEPRRRSSCIWVIILAIILISVIAIVGFNKGFNKYKLNMNTTATVTTIEANKTNSTSKVFIKANACIKEIMRQIEKLNETESKTPSISDQPVVDEYYTLGFVSNDNKEVVYLYEKDDKCYLEEPHNAIFELPKESYDIMMEYINIF